jgi:sortase A
MKWRAVCIGVVAVIGAWQLGAGLYIHAKACLAQRLIASAWTQTLHGARQVKPWPWADSWPVARLRVPGSKVDLYVLADASGRTLAFGPGHVSGTASLGSTGAAMIAGHRDTHFRFLRTLTRDSIVLLELPDGSVRRYRLTETHVLDTRTERLEVNSARPTLTLFTCYPFDAVRPGGPLRYAAVAEAM